jgi:hypothetical protein
MEAVLSVDDVTLGVNRDGLNQTDFFDVPLELADVGRIDTPVQLVEFEPGIVFCCMYHIVVVND